ncbi:nucleoside phosphorylase domain-containing protein [Neohortaea acidophila]|uniref:Purine nucleoside phosphorylase n=1 Tax=Neohortaea acidophila TaxID=245834 RepID=A0A6A6PWY8_9PEZI|nr:nucleoside phosphorylase domain-containing protein [Neohortaea acidophila]KAF2484552.1 nucleoside phosphorylase domain-containing protein [Neohortaea acidophila]
MATSSIFHRANETAEHLRLRLPEHLARPRVGIVCGSGLGGLAATVNQERDEDGKAVSWEWAYKDVPNFPLSTVVGHEGKLVFGTMGAHRVPVVLLVGRAHFYEGHDMSAVTFAVRVCRVLGCQTMLLTNAAGGLNPDYSVGDLLCLNDHLNFVGVAGFHPLRGPNDDDFGVRFPPLSDAYDLRLRQLAHKAWRDIQSEHSSKGSASTRRMHEGVYAFLSGPTYETRAECRMLRLLGADVVGMSTVPEIIVSRHSGMRVLAFSLVTNKAVLEPTVRADDPAVQGLSEEEMDAYLRRGMADHTEVLEEGRLAAIDMQSLVMKVVSGL